MASVIMQTIGTITTEFWAGVTLGSEDNGRRKRRDETFFLIIEQRGREEKMSYRSAI